MFLFGVGFLIISVGDFVENLSCFEIRRVESLITDHLRDHAPNLEKYEVVQFFPV